MSDKYESIRSLPFPALAAALGLDMGNYRQRKHGQEWYGPCPIHKPKQNNTSFSYAQDGKFFCFSCNAKGRGMIDLVKQIRACGFEDAVRFLEVIQPLPKQKAPPAAISDATEGVLQPLAKDSWRKFTVPCPWLEQRIPDAAVRERYGVFCYENKARKSAYSGRVMIPVKDMQGNLYGYLGRAVASESAQPRSQDSPKYLFPKNLPKSRFLFGAWELAKGLYLPHVRQGEPHTGALPLKVVYLVESPLCVLRFACIGLPAVAAYGWSFSDEQVKLIATLAKGAIYLPDRNKYQEASVQCWSLARLLWLRFPPLPAGIDDPEQMTREQILAL